MNRISNGAAIPAPPKDKAKDWQLEILMEKLRSKSAQFKSLAEISKNVRMTMLDKRYALDSVEKSQHQKCLDTLQHSIKVTSLQSMVERLESLTRQLGLKFVVEPSGVFISSDMFYLEIVLESTGAVKDVKIHHEGKMEQQSCLELVNCLSRGDFADFTAQLEGFSSIYQLNAEKKVKCKAFAALESLEMDLSTLAQMQMFMKESNNLIYKSPVGILEKRRGGHPMKLTYFVSPYDLINVEKGDIDSVCIESIINKGLGYSVTVCMEGSAAHKLQTTLLINVTRGANGKSTPSYAPLTNANSTVIPACFMLKLNKPMPMCISLIKKIQQIHPWTEIDSAPVQPLLNLIVSHCSDGKMNSSNNKGLFVNLPDQDHCYFVTESKNMNGVLVSSIPFTHPGHVSSILGVLREQALFNTIICSCVRPNSKQDFDNMIMFEVSALSSTHISISLEHPVEESMATAELDLKDISNLVCRIHNPGTPPPANAPDVASELSTKVLNRTFSIPVTLRSVIKLWEKQAVRRNYYNGHENFSLPLGSGDPGGHKGAPGNNLSEFGGLDHKVVKQEPGGNNHAMMMHHQGIFLNESMIASANFQGFPPSDGVLTNIELNSILAGDKLAKKKRKATEDLVWKGSKRRVGEDDLLESSSCDSTSRSTPLSQDEIQTPSSGLGFQSDLELSGLDPTELLGGSDRAEFDNIDDLGDVEEILAGTSKRKLHDKSPSSQDSCDKIVSPSISITPISSASSPGLSPTDKRGIEIIPITQSSLLPSSITITPISGKEDKKDRKSSKSRDDKNKLEKKRKKKRDESPMGPPDKVPLKQDALSKPVTVSIKPAESPPLPTSTPTSPSMIRKYNASPTQNRSLSISGKLSPSLIKTNLKHVSPKHSPAHIPSSPKHIAISSPKSHGTSPKHPSTASSGKPSMSTLKNAANSPSGKSGGDLKKVSKEARDKKMGFFGVGGNSKKSVKKPLELSVSPEMGGEGMASPGADGGKNLNQMRNRKGSLSAIVDKLKNAQHCDIAADLAKRDRLMVGKGMEAKKLGEAKNSEYMVKPSSDGMKITINKTRKESKSKVAGSSPKVHTGLKPGVNSGPASKKPQQAQKLSGGNMGVGPSFLGVKSVKVPGKVLNSAVKPKGGSPKTVDLMRKDRVKPIKTEKSIFSMKAGKASPTPREEDIFKMTYNTPLMMKQLDKNFQIPKLSARSDDKKGLSKDGINMNRSTVDAKLFDLMSKGELSPSKYPLGMGGKLVENSVGEKGVRNNLNSLSSGAKLKDGEFEDGKVLDVSNTQGKDESYLIDPISASKSFPLSNSASDPLSLPKTVELIPKFVAPAPRDEKKDKVKSGDADMLLNYSSGKSELSKGTSLGSQHFPQSPSVSVHIVKSPAPSPLINPSPHSASPCITDDELMDEALVGLGK